MTAAEIISLRRWTVNVENSGLTKRAFLIRLIEGRPVRARPSQEIKELGAEVHHIGNNINQIAKK